MCCEKTHKSSSQVCVSHNTTERPDRAECCSPARHTISCRCCYRGSSPRVRFQHSCGWYLYWFCRLVDSLNRQNFLRVTLGRILQENSATPKLLRWCGCSIVCSIQQKSSAKRAARGNDKGKCEMEVWNSAKRPTLSVALLRSFAPRWSETDHQPTGAWRSRKERFFLLWKQKTKDMVKIS